MKFDFTLRKAKNRSFAAGKSQMKDWPDEWVCQTCAWVAPCKSNRKRVYCRKWRRGVGANSDRACYEEPLEMLRKRKRYETKNNPAQAEKVKRWTK